MRVALPEQLGCVALVSAREEVPGQHYLGRTDNGGGWLQALAQCRSMLQGMLFQGCIYQGKALKNIRYRHRSLRKKLQKKSTKGARRRLRRLAGQERRFATWVNHNLSKRIVAKAEGTKRAIALEELTHIRTRMTARRSQRATLHSWAFAQLKTFIVYKAALRGVSVHFVNPRNTSRTCPQCGCIDKNNRKTQASFICTPCGFAGLADVIAAGNISRRAAVNPLYCSDADTSVAPGQSRRL